MFDSNPSKEEEKKDNSSDIEKFEEELYEEFVKRGLPDEYNPEKVSTLIYFYLLFNLSISLPKDVAFS